MAPDSLPPVGWLILAGICAVLTGALLMLAVLLPSDPPQDPSA